MNLKQINGVWYTHVELVSLETYSSFECVEKQIKEVGEKVKSGEWLEVVLDMCDEPYDDRRYPAFVGYRRATEDEVEKYQKLLEQAKESRERYDRARFEELKKKFGE